MGSRGGEAGLISSTSRRGAFGVGARYERTSSARRACRRTHGGGSQQIAHQFGEGGPHPGDDETAPSPLESRAGAHPRSVDRAAEANAPGTGLDAAPRLLGERVADDDNGSSLDGGACAEGDEDREDCRGRGLRPAHGGSSRLGGSAPGRLRGRGRRRGGDEAVADGGKRGSLDRWRACREAAVSILGPASSARREVGEQAALVRSAPHLTCPSHRLLAL